MDSTERVPISQDRLETSWQATLNIWIQRFKESQKVVRELEDENEVLRERITELIARGSGVHRVPGVLRGTSPEVDHSVCET